MDSLGYNLDAFKEPDDHQNFMQRILSDHMKRASQEFEDKLTEYLQKNLLTWGHVFTSKEDWYEFVKARITRVSHIDKPNYWEVYLDKTPEDPGIFIGCYSDKVTFEGEGATMKIIFGE